MYWLTAILGVAMAVAPFVFGYNTNTPALQMSVILGLIVVLASILEGLDQRKSKWEWGLVGIAGIVAVIAPFVFGFTAVTMAFWTMIVLGAMVLALAGYELFFTPQPV
jgi:uncharacterized membrane protein HdeD (DUF308 family)